MARLKLIALVVALVMTTVLAACAGKATPMPTPAVTPTPTPAVTPAPTPRATPTPLVADWDKVVAAAKTEGKVVAYDAFWAMSPPERTQITEAFEKASGIKVELTVLSTPESRERIRVEQRSGQVVADVVLSATVMPYDMWKAGYTVPTLVPAGLEKGVWKEVDPYYLKKTEGHVVTTHVSPQLGALVNTNLVKPEEEPKFWTDFLDPKWKGKITLPDPRVPGFQPSIAEILKVTGWDFLAKLAKQEPVLVPGITVPVDRVVRGESSLGLGLETKLSFVNLQKGAPVKLVQFKDAVHTMPFGGFIQKGAPHPNAAKVFMNWLLTQEGQTVLSKAGLNPSLRKDVPQDWLPPVFQFREGYKYIWLDEELTEVANEKVMPYAREVFGQ